MVRRGWFELCLEIGPAKGLNLEDEVKGGIEGLRLRFWA